MAAKSKASETRPRHRSGLLRPGDHPPGPTETIPQEKGGCCRQAAEGLSPPRVSSADSECDDFYFRTIKPCKYELFGRGLQEKSSLLANKTRRMCQNS